MKILCLLFLLLCGESVFAHGNVSEKIKQLNAKIAAEPDNLQWRFQRGVNWLLNLQADHAVDDLSFVIERQADYPSAQLYLARALVLEEEFSEAETAFSMALIYAEGNREAQKEVLIHRASSRQQQHQYAIAADDWLRLIGLYKAELNQPNSENTIQADWVLFAARNLYAAGAVTQALTVLQRGRDQLGPVLLLEEQLIDWLLVQKNFDAALHRIDSLITRSERPDIWLVRKGDVLLRQGKPELARECFTSALKQLMQLPEHVKQRPAFAHDLQQLQRKLAALR